MNTYSIVMAHTDELGKAASLASRAMINLPENRAVFRGKRDRLESAFTIIFNHMPGHIVLAKDRDEIVGIMRLVQWPYCKPSSLEKLRFLPSMFLALKGSLPRGLRLQGMWTQHDPQEPHMHLDPLAVRQDYQGKGVGTALMNYLCDYVDVNEVNAYLETGTERNVHFYNRFGFDVVDKASALGTTTWFMWRPKEQEAA